MVRVTTEKIGKIPVEIYVSSSGFFQIYYTPDFAREPDGGNDPNDPDLDDQPRGEHLAGDYNLEAALKQAKQVIRDNRRRVAVPFRTAEGYDAIAKGFHGSSRDKILVWINDPNAPISARKRQNRTNAPTGRNTTLDSFSLFRRRVLKPDTTLQSIKHRTKLLEHKTRAEALIRKWDERHTFDLRDAVISALRELEKESSSQSQSHT